MRTLKSDFMDILESQRIKPVFQLIVCLKTGEFFGLMDVRCVLLTTMVLLILNHAMDKNKNHR